MIRSGQEVAIETDKPASEAIGPGPAWPARASDAPRVKNAAERLVTWAGQTVDPLLHPGNETTSPRLHFLIADYIIGLGFVVAGWFADPLSEVAAISVDSAVGVTLDLFSTAEVLTDRHQNQGFNAPSDVAVKFGFVLLVPEQALGKADGLHLRLRLATGETRHCIVPPVGAVAHLSNILDAAPDDYALRIIERLLKAWSSNGSRSPHLPERLEALAQQIHRRIEPRRNFGTQADTPNASYHVDKSIRVGTAGILLAGWLISDQADSIKEIALVSLFGRRAVLGAPLATKDRPGAPATEIGQFARPDSSYAVFAAIEGLDRRDRLWFLEVIMEDGTIKRVPFVCPPEPSPLQGIEASLMLAEPDVPDLCDLFERTIAPAVEWFWGQTRRSQATAAEIVYGSPPIDPSVSIIVPVYGRLDFVRHQIARFSGDPEFSAATGVVELIYVLDEPTEAGEFGRLCRFLYDIYGVPFRTFVQSKNSGYAASTNAGAATAKGAVLLLLNSDVFPTKPRWIGHLVRSYNTLDRCGILGCRLLFEDGSIQHAGMAFRTSPTLPGCWENDHPGKGLSVPFDAHSSAEPVPAVTGACLMIERTLFSGLGGMSEEYVIGDFEDSDLCLKVQERGLRVYYTPEVELYHLERQSMRLIGQGNLWWQQSLTLYNMWKHSRRWGELIPKIMGGFEQASAATLVRHPNGSREGDRPQRGGR